MTNRTVWAVLHDRDDSIAAGPFNTVEEANAYVGGFDDVYAVRVDAAEFDRLDAAVKARVNAIATAYHGATHADLVNLLRELADVLGVPGLSGLADTLGNLHDEPGRDVLTVQEHRVELGLCPDRGDHMAEHCDLYQCQTWAATA